MTMHIWLCADKPRAYGSVELSDDNGNLAEWFEVMVEQMPEVFLDSDHTHDFGTPRISPKGYNVFHECPGKLG